MWRQVTRNALNNNGGGALTIVPLCRGLSGTEFMLRSDFTHTQIHWTASFPFFSLPHTEARVRYNLWSCSRTIRSCGSLLYDINLGATTTTIHRIGGAQIPIDLVSSATDSYRRSVVLFKLMSVSTSDPKSEFLYQSSSTVCNLQTSPEPPRTPGISPTPLSPRITRIATVQVLSQSTSSRSSVYNGLRDLVVAYPL